MPPLDWLRRLWLLYHAGKGSFPLRMGLSARDWQALEAAGWKRLAMVRNLELVRALFRRPLELWLLLDRCLYLVEQGYSVRLGEFCPTSLSPRNLLILAERS